MNDCPICTAPAVIVVGVTPDGLRWILRCAACEHEFQRQDLDEGN